MKVSKRSGAFIKGVLVSAAVLLGLNLLVLGPTLRAQTPGNRPLRVLVLYWDNKDFPGNVKFDESFRAGLASFRNGNVEYYPEYIETTRFPGQDQSFFRDYLRQKYADRPIDALVASADIPLKFLTQYRSELFTNSPIIFLSNNPPSAENLAAGPGMTGVVHQSTHRETLELALKLHPGTRQVFVISGSPEGDKRFEKVARVELGGFEDRVKVEYLTDLPLKDLISRTSTLPPQSVVLYVWQQTPNEQGRLLETYEVLARITPTASAPIYGMGSGNLGVGIVGGYLQGPESNGAKTAELVLRVLNGTRPQDIRVQNAPTVPMFDARQLQRWGISEASLPPGSVVRFSETTFWQNYKWYVIGLVSAIVVEALLIAWLLFSQVRLKRAERESRRLNELHQQAHQRLGQIVANVPGVVWETRLDPQTRERKTTFISDYVEKMLGYTAEEWLSAPPGLGLRIMPEEEREAAVSDIEAVLTNGTEGTSQFHWQAKDGRLVCAENYLSAIIEGDKIVGLRGVTLDITDRKLAEENARQTEERQRATLNAIPDLMLLHTSDGVCLDYHCTDTGDLIVPPKEFLGKNMREVLPPDLAEEFVGHFKRALETGETQIVEYELTLKGERRFFESRLVRSGNDVLSIVRNITESKKAQNDLRESENRLRMAQNAARVGTWEWNVTTGDSVWSEMIWNLLGLEPFTGESTVNRFAEFIHPDDRERALRKVNAALTNGGNYYDEFRIIPRNGKTFWVSSKGKVLRSADGKPERMIGVNIDINDRKIAEETARETKQKDAAILQAIPDLMFLQSRDGVYLDYHAKDPVELLLAPEKFLGKNMHEVLPPELAEQFDACFERAEEGGEPQILEYSVNLNEQDRWYEARIVRSGENILSVVRDITQRVFIEEAVKRSESQLAAIIGSAMDAIITVDNNRRILLFNTAAEKTFGCTMTQAIGQSLDRFIPESFRLTRGKHVETNGQHGHEDQLRNLLGVRYSGEEFPIEASSSQIELNGQDFYTVILRDTTERKRAIDQLRQSEQRFSKAFRSNPQPMSLTTVADGRYIDVNESFLAVSGYTREEVIGHTSLELGIWETPAERIKFIKELEQQGSLVNREAKFRVKSGSLRLLLSSAERIFIGGEECLLIASSDITERMAAQQALQESEARFRNMADTAPVMIWVSGIDRGCAYVNQTWLDFTGRTMEEEKGTGWTQGIHPDDREVCWTVYETAFENREAFTIEFRLRRTDGAYRWVLASGTPRFALNHDFLGYIGSCIDIGERKESEEALLAAHDDLVIAHEEVNRLKNQLEAENLYLQEELRSDQTFGEIVGQSHALKYVLFKVSQIAPTDSTVLIMGETGTGKELFARAVHDASLRKSRPLIRVNCAALPASLIESELFGYEKGAFTGASARKLGRFELADGGTIFLDEIGDLPMESQVKLLRVIQEGEIERLGGTKTIKINVRLIAATNRNLKQEIEKGTFREDLWYRLNVFPITVPPLRQRRDDVSLLTEYFASKSAKKFGKKIESVSAAALRTLEEHSWPGNVRELENVIERAVIYCQGPVLQLAERFETPPETSALDLKTLEQVEREYIIRVLESTGGRIEGANGAARLLGLNPSTLRTRLAKLGIQKQSLSATK